MGTRVLIYILNNQKKWVWLIIIIIIILEEGSNVPSGSTFIPSQI